MIPLARHPARAAEYIQPAPSAKARIGRPERRVKVNVISQVKVQVAVEVVVAKGRSRAPAAKVDAPLGRHIHERAVALVFVQGVGAKVGQVQVGPAIPVVVGRRNPHAPAHVRDARLAAHARKAPSPIVAVQLGAGFAARGVSSEARTVDDENIHVAVEVVVEQGRPAGVAFDDVLLLRRSRYGAQVNARFGRYIHEKGPRLVAGAPYQRPNNREYPPHLLLRSQGGRLGAGRSALVHEALLDQRSPQAIEGRDHARVEG